MDIHVIKKLFISEILHYQKSFRNTPYEDSIILIFYKCQTYTVFVAGYENTSKVELSHWTPLINIQNFRRSPWQAL